MAPAATLNVAVRFATGAQLATGFVLGDTTYGVLGGPGVLDGAPAVPITVTSTATRALIRRGKQRVLDKYEVGQATVEIIDTTGAWDPTNVSSPFYPNVLPMRQIVLTATYSGTVYPVFAGYIDGYTYDYQPGVNAARVSIKASDGFKVLNNSTVSTVVNAAGDLTGTRVNNLLDAVSWPPSMRSVSAGRTTLQVDPGTVRTAADAISTVSDSEFGAFFFDGGGNAVFRDRDSLVLAAANSPTAFADDGTGIAYMGVTFAHDDVLIANDVTVSRVGGTPQEVQDAASQAAYYKQSLERTNLLMDSDDDALNQATSILTMRKDPKVRIESFVLDLSENVSARVLAGLTLTFGDVVSLKKSQPGGSSLVATLSVQGVEHEVTPASWRTTFRTGEQQLTGFILGSAQSGVLGTSSFSY